VTQTLHRLLFIEALASGLIVLLVGGAALVLVRTGLRPLEDIGDVAGAIAEGDLSQRVPRAEERTEVGRLGLSLNAMLGQIQSAFEARQASEDRLRRFVADASHELRTPLTSIRGYAELFRRGAAERPADLEKAMRRIEEESVRMGLLVDDLLLLARLDQGRPLDRSPVDLVRVAADAVDDARAAAPERSISLEAPDRLVIEGDDLRLRQVAANLVANAYQHTPAETPVVVRVTTGEGEAVLEVADRGPGLDPEAAQKVFERFYRADPSRARSGGGSGLGLSIVAAIAEAHGGRATVDSTPGTGACFRVSLPTGHRPAPRAEPADFSPTTGSSPPDPVPEAAVAPLAPPAAPPSASVPVVSSWAAPTSPPAPATEPDD
ncbi:MAG: two-component system, OmpR family, sensor kinase, partial [Acidimicrobiaceae bacterium]